MQVIGTEAQGDDAMLRELSEKVRVAEVSSGVSGLSIAPRVTSAVGSSQVSPLASRAEPFVAPATEQAADPGQNAAPAPPAEAEPKEAEAEPCTPDISGAQFCIYVVQDGDTLSNIAEDLGLESTVAFSGAELIALSNGLNDAQNWLILIGQELRVPLASGVIHTVGESETVSVLAELYGVPTADVVAANGLADANSVVAGETLLIPSPSLWPLSGPTAVVEETAPTVDTGEAEGETPEDSTEPESAGADDPNAGATGEQAGDGDETPDADASASPATGQPETPRAASSANANPSVGEVRDAFAAGYIAGGGPAQYLEYILANVIPCESGYNLRAFNPAGPFYGLMQFHPETWANTGGGDWFDAWQQGHNTGILLQRSSPATQWPSCWR